MVVQVKHTCKTYHIVFFLESYKFMVTKNIKIVIFKG